MTISKNYGTALEQKNFYAAAAEVFDSVCIFLTRLAAQAAKSGANEVAATLQAIAVRPPETLRQALQLALIYDECQELEGEPVRSQGIFDRIFVRFYRHDLEQHILDRGQAREMLKFFWTKFYAQGHPNNKNICFGGLIAPDTDSCNELTALCLDIHYELNRENPKLSLRINPATPQKILEQATNAVRCGRTSIVFNNDEVAFKLFRKRGKTEKDIYNYTLIGCYEPAIAGREMCCSMAAGINLAKPLEAIFNHGCSFSGERIGPDYPEPVDYEGLEAAYLNQLQYIIETVLEDAKAFERLWSQVNPSPLLSGTMESCLNSGRDVSAAGAVYNQSGVMCVGLGTAVDSLAAVKRLVYEQRIASFKGLAAILKNNWEQHDELRLEALTRAPKWGTHSPETDATARRIVTFASTLINSHPNTRGGTFQMGLWSIDYDFRFGTRTGATPCGRLAGEPLSRNSGSSAGMEKNGVTALMNSVSGLNLAECPGGTVLDVMLHPSVISGADGAQILADLILCFFAMGGMTVHFNVFDAEELKRAQRDPDKYRNLQVRVCGWNSKFVNLSREEQNVFIARAEAAE